MKLEKQLVAESEMLTFGASLARSIPQGVMIYLYGQLGAGKTTLVRGMLRGFGYAEKVKSPTYTIVEPYDVAGKMIYHFDLYRLVDSSELAQIGIADYFGQESICLVEWPEKGFPLLPVPDIACYIDTIEEGRSLRLESHTPRGEDILSKL